MEACHCVSFPGNGLDIRTPRNEFLTAFFKRSYAHHTVKVRMPVIITQTIDNLVRNKEAIATDHGLESVEELKTVIGELSKFKYELQTNKELTPLKSKEPDANYYNKVLKVHMDQNMTCSYFNMLWLFVECYMYRRIRESFEMTATLHSFDPFQCSKVTSYESGLPLMKSLSRHMLSIFEEENRDDATDFKKLLKINLWGNKCDLSHSNGQEVTPTTNLIESQEDLTKQLLADMSDDVWIAACMEHRFQIIDIVLDNAGYEVFTDFCVADFLITKKLAAKVRFYVKIIPWFISDVMRHDFEWTIEQLVNSDDAPLKALGDRWKQYVEDGVWTIEEHNFWTMPFEYKHMFKIDEDLYRKLARAKLVIFKGDLNYRKLIGERYWDPTTPLETCLSGFHPSRVCTLRTLKAETVCGLEDAAVKRAEAEDPDWLISGNFGVIQFCGKVVHLL